MRGLVAPLVGAWIEIYIFRSAPRNLFIVAPLVGAWIEITKYHGAYKGGLVTPFVGVWIEIIMIQWIEYDDVSLPSWECGLKLQLLHH